MTLVPSVPVEDVSRTVDFYHHVLGFELVGATGKGNVTRARLRLGEVEILFRSARTDSISQALRKQDLEDRLTFHMRVDDVYGLYNRVKGHASVVRELETTLFGQGEFAIEDIDGIVLSFSQPHVTSGSARGAATREDAASGVSRVAPANDRSTT